MNVLDLLKNTDYDVQQYIGDILKPIRYEQRKKAHEKMFADTLDELDDLHQFYIQAKYTYGDDPNEETTLASFPVYLRHLDYYEGEETTEDYFPFHKYDTGREHWGAPQLDIPSERRKYRKIRREIENIILGW